VLSVQEGRGLAEVPKTMKSSIVGRRQVAEDQEIWELELRRFSKRKQRSSRSREERFESRGSRSRDRWIWKGRMESLLFHSLPLNRCHPDIFSWFSLQIHSPMARLLEIHFGNLPCRRSTTPSSRIRLGIWFPFLQEGNLSGVDGSIGPRAQRMDRLADTTPC
jgi:hypothetical protein